MFYNALLHCIYIIDKFSLNQNDYNAGIISISAILDLKTNHTHHTSIHLLIELPAIAREG